MTAFLYLLRWVTYLRDQNGTVLWFLPVAGFFIGAIYHYYGSGTDRGSNLILQQIYLPTKQLPFVMAPLILFTTLLTHVFGGSVGREGTAVQMAAALADQIGHLFKIKNEHRSTLLICGIGAGFSAAIGAPFAGMIFGLEVLRDKSFWKKAFVPTAFSSFLSYFVTRLLFAPHTDFPQLQIPHWGWDVFCVVLVCGLLFGGAAYFFILLLTAIRAHFDTIQYPPLRPFFGGIVLVLLYSLEGSYKYVGLGLESIQNSLITPSEIVVPVYKIFFTTLTIGSGFAGGEFIPLVFVGTTLGSSIGLFFPAYFSLAAGLGFSSVFAAASKTPIACSIMAIELFGVEVAPYAFVCHFIACFVSGKKSVYSSQKKS